MMGSFFVFVLVFYENCCIFAPSIEMNVKFYPSALVCKVLFGRLTGNFLKSL